jgi:hypothetical protein
MMAMTRNPTGTAMDNSEVYDSLLPGRRFCLSKSDLDDYGRLLLEAYPDMRFFRISFAEKEDQRQPPVLRFHDNLASANYGGLDIIFLPENWEPQWSLDTYSKRWYHGGMPWPNGTIGCSGKIDTTLNHGQPFMDTGEIYFRCRKGNKNDMRVARKCLRLVTKVASNQNQVHVDFPSMKVLRNAPNDLWIGHDARRWLLEDPRRITEYGGGTITQAVRPSE